MKTKSVDYETAADKPQNTKDIIGMLRVAVVSYAHTPIQRGGTATIGEIVDAHIREVISCGGNVSEVSLSFEGIEQQQMLADIYRDTKY